MANWWASRLVEENAGHVFLSAYRGFALVVATFQVFFVGHFELYGLHNWILLGLVGAYTLFKVSRPFRWYGKNAFTYADFSFDLALSVSLLLFTGGLISPFLLYSLCPVLTAALFFSRKLTFSIVGIPVLALIAGQVFPYTGSSSMSSYPVELSLGLLSAVAVASFLMAWLPYIMNINASQIVKTKAVLGERKRLSREIHDGVAQSLGIVHWKIEYLQQTMNTCIMPQALSQVTEIKRLIEEAQYEVKATIEELRTSIEGKGGLVLTLARYATEFTRAYGIRCELHVADGQVNLPLSAELELLRIAREALSNVRKHSIASAVEVTFKSQQDSIEMTISDNGLGFDLEADFPGYGLAVMEERAQSLGGEFSITTSPGHGTKITVTLPASRTQSPTVDGHIGETLLVLDRKETDGSD